MPDEKSVEEGRAWLEEHPNEPGSLPGNAPPGETQAPHRSSMLSGRGQGRESRSGPRSVISYDQFGTVEVWEKLWSDQPYEPLVGRVPGQPSHLDGEDLVRRARIEHVMSYLLPEHVDLLLMRHAEQLSLADIGDRLGVTKQAIHKRLATAEQDFRRAYGQHYWDLVDV